MYYKIIELKTTFSTNSFAKELLVREKVPEGTVIYAFEQNAGRGMGNNLWESEAGKNLTISLILRPDFLATNMQFMISKVVSLAIIDYLDSLNIIQQVSIKWPNDIYADLKKIAGILIEHDISGSTIEHSIIGIGLNANQERFFSDAPNPVSLKNFTNKDTDIRSVLNSVLHFISLRYRQLKEKEYDSLNSDYLKMLLFYNTSHQYISNRNTFTGVITNVDQFGRLQINTDEGALRSFEMKEVTFVL